MSKVVVTLSDDERAALVRCAISELRVPTDQARLIIRRELQRRRLLAPDAGPIPTTDPHEPVTPEAVQ